MAVHTLTRRLVAAMKDKSAEYTLKELASIIDAVIERTREHLLKAMASTELGRMGLLDPEAEAVRYRCID